MPVEEVIPRYPRDTVIHLTLTDSLIKDNGLGKDSLFFASLITFQTD
jgi:hypothetical protein